MRSWMGSAAACRHTSSTLFPTVRVSVGVCAPIGRTYSNRPAQAISRLTDATMVKLPHPLFTVRPFPAMRLVSDALPLRAAFYVQATVRCNCISAVGSAPARHRAGDGGHQKQEQEQK